MHDQPFGEKELRVFLRDAPYGLALFLANGEIAFCNDHAQHVLGIYLGENHGPTLVNHHRQIIDVYGSVIPSTQDPVRTALLSSKPAEHVVGIRGPGSQLKWVLLSTMPHVRGSDPASAVSVTFSLVPGPQPERPKTKSSSEIYQPLHPNSKIGLWTWNYRSGLFQHDRGFSSVTKTGQTASIEEWSKSVIEQDRMKFLLNFDLLQAGMPKVEFAYKTLRGNGSLQLYFVRGTTTDAFASQGATIEGSVVDISALLPGILEVGELVDSMTDGYVSLDRNWLVTFMNKRAERLLRTSANDVVGTRIWDQFPSGFGTEIDRQLQVAMSGKHVTFDFYNGDARAWFEIRAHPIPNGVAVYFRDVTEQRAAAEERERLLSLSEEAKERLSYAASHDSLTDLPNRTSLLSWIDSSLEKLSQGRALAIMFLDLDRFKRVNDTHGHAEGDRVLTQTSKVLRKIVDADSTVARLGGDEFVVAAQVNSVAEANIIANGILHELAKPIKVNERPLVVTASIGISISDDHSTAETLLRDADVALYAAKEDGRNRVRLFDNAIRQKVVSRLDTEADLRDALKLDQISIHYQPIFSAETHRLSGFETLTRWFHRDKGAIAPEIFISVAEESGLILPLSEYMISSTLDVFPHLSTSADDDMVTVWINVSSKQLEDNSFVNHLFKSCQERCKPGQLGIELTESVLSRDSSELHSLLNSLSSEGIKIAIDDFGRGYSSLSQLARYPIDLIILNRSLVDEISTSPGSALAPALVNLAHAINAQVCVSGIETEQQLRLLLDFGVDLVSGFYLGQPQPVTTVSDAVALGRHNLARVRESSSYPAS